MTLTHKNRTLAVAWIVVIVAAALMASVASLTGWMVVSVMVLSSSIMLLQFLNALSPATSLCIQESRR